MLIQHPDLHPRLTGLVLAALLTLLVAGAGLFVAVDVHARQVLGEA